MVLPMVMHLAMGLWALSLPDWLLVKERGERLWNVSSTWNLMQFAT
jgi:hypothetical protein